MSKRESIARYTLIINRLRKSPATLAEINDYLKLQSELQEYDFTISNRTFQRDKADIRSLYNVDIEYDFSQKTYYIKNEEQSDVNERMLEAFNVFHALNTAEGLSKYVLFEKRQPKGTEHLFGLLHAIKTHLLIKFGYQKFINEASSNRKVEPYILKEFRNRWYVVGKDTDDCIIKCFALDRLSELEITKRTFTIPSSFDAENYFKYCFGIIVPEAGTEPQEVIISFEPIEAKYIKSLPLHESQTVMLENKKEVLFKLNVFITIDFIMELLSHGKKLKILQPQSLIDDMKKNTFK